MSVLCTVDKSYVSADTCLDTQWLLFDVTFSFGRSENSIETFAEKLKSTFDLVIMFKELKMTPNGRAIFLTTT